MHARPYVYATFGRWALQAALPLCNIRALKVKGVILLQMYYPQDRYCEESE